MTCEGPQCPECDEPVLVVADSCTACGAAPDGATDRGAVSTAVVELGSEPGTDDDADAGGRQTSPPPRSVIRDRATAARERISSDRPPGTVATRSVTVAGGLVVGVLATLLALLATASAWGGLAGPVAFLGTTSYVGRARTVRGAVRRAGVLAAPGLLALPLFWIGASPPGRHLASYLVAFVGVGALAGGIGACLVLCFITVVAVGVR